MPRARAKPSRESSAPQTHEAEAQGQDQVRHQEGDAQGRGVLGEGQQALDLAPAEIGDDAGQDEEEGLDDDPADVLQALRQFVINDVDADGRPLPDGDGKGQIGDPDKDIAGKLFGPDGGAGALDELCNDIAVNDLPRDEQDDGEQARHHENFFKIFVEPGKEPAFALHIFTHDKPRCKRKRSPARGRAARRRDRSGRVTSGFLPEAAGCRPALPWRTFRRQDGSWP